jgi:hypothetical protein
VVELFTSEGCSSCPPADDTLLRLAAEQRVDGAEIIPLELHVDYWNDLGWSDPFSQADFSMRQRAYADARGTTSVFTPEAIVDGATSVVGSHEAELVEAVRRAASAPHVEVELSVASGFARVSIPEEARGRGDLWLAITEAGLVSEVRAGENRGRTLRHAPVARHLKHVGPVGADGVSIGLPSSVAEGEGRQVVAILASTEDGHVLGARSARW